GIAVNARIAISTMMATSSTIVKPVSANDRMPEFHLIFRTKENGAPTPASAPMVLRLPPALGTTNPVTESGRSFRRSVLAPPNAGDLFVNQQYFLSDYTNL